jgi:death-on-curing protein
MKDYIWVLEDVVHAIHDEQIAEHGGLEGVRDLSLLNSALARPRNLISYESPNIADLAASYAIGIAKNHPFNDGNKRTAFVVMELFLALNGFELFANDGECVLTMLQVASGDISEEELSAWLKSNIHS